MYLGIKVSIESLLSETICFVDIREDRIDEYLNE